MYRLDIEDSKRKKNRCPRCLHRTMQNTGKPFPWRDPPTYDPPLIDANEYILWECTYIAINLKTGEPKKCGHTDGQKPDGSHSRDRRMNEVLTVTPEATAQ